MVWLANGSRWIGAASAVLAVCTAGCGGNSASFDRRGSSAPGGGGTGGIATGGVATGGVATGGVAAGGVAAGGAGASNAGSGGTDGQAGSGGAGGQAGSGPDIGGDWAMFVWEDPVGVALVQTGNVLTGSGCCAGLYGTTGIDCCGGIEGVAGDGRARFSFSFNAFGETTLYYADVFVSADGQRMLGTFNGSAWTAWTRLDALGQERGWLVSADTALSAAVTEREGIYELRLTEASEPSGDFLPGEVYRIVLRGDLPLLSGDLGPFWAGEMAWREAEETLVVGPVPVTAPASPIGARLLFEQGVLATVEATMPSGTEYTFDASPSM